MQACFPSSPIAIGLGNHCTTVIKQNHVSAALYISPLVQPPQLQITSNIGGVVVAGDSYSMRCEVTFNDDLLLPIQIRWMNPSGN